jgi:hypothetical protein
MGYNRFGAVYTSVIDKYPQTVIGDYGSQANVEEAIDRACDQIANALTPAHYRALTQPELEMVVVRATAGQTSATLGLKPVVAGSVHLWRGQPSSFLETDAALFSVVALTGVVTLSSGLAVNDQVYATYVVDVAAATFSMPSLARLACRGAAAELGMRLYGEQQQEWQLVETYRKGFADDLDALRSGELVPDEIRAMRFWQEVERSSRAGGSVSLPRG